MPDQTAVPPADATTEARIAAAFGALVTAEVPTAAPRPPQAPRPPVRDDRGRRRRFGLATGGVLVAAAAVVVALVVGGEVDDARQTPTAPPGTGGTVTTTAPTSPRTPVSSTPDPSGVDNGTTGTPDPPPSATRAQIEQAFAAISTDTRSPVVAVPGGWEGADLDEGTIRFWHASDGLTWSVEGTSTYPADVRGDAQVAYTSTVDGAALLTGMQHATFLLRGSFTGDSSGNVIDYTEGGDGWGVVKAGPDGDLDPSGQPVAADQIGLMFEGDLVDGLLQTVDCDFSSGTSQAECGLPANQVVKYWRWDGTQFVLDH